MRLSIKEHTCILKKDDMTRIDKWKRGGLEYILYCILCHDQIALMNDNKHILIRANTDDGFPIEVHVIYASIVSLK